MPGQKPIVGQQLLGMFDLVRWAAVMHAQHWRGLDAKKGARYWLYDETDVAAAMPYGVHPAWCVFSILQEPRPTIDDIRTGGAAALAVHDLVEDTFVTFSDLEAKLTELKAARTLITDVPQVLDLVHQMTFDSSNEELDILSQPTGPVHLLKLYDKASTLQDGWWMWNKARDYRVPRIEYVVELAQRVHRKYGELNIVVMARHLARKYRTSALGDLGFELKE